MTTVTWQRAATDAPFLVAARGGRPTRRPLWIMRQAGRYLPEYREVRARLSFLELCHDPTAAAEVTLQPIRRYGMDAAILFTDLLIPVPPMGIELRYEPGPVLERTVRDAAAVDALAVPEPERDLAPMLATASRVRAALEPERALIGFVGAPFTMACYLVEGRGSKQWNDTRRFLHEDPVLFGRLLERITDAMIPLATALLDHGCDAIQVFDSWASVLDTDTYARTCAPQTDRILRAVRDAGGVAIDYVNGATQHLGAMAESNAHMLAVDWRSDLGEMRSRVPAAKGLQGNLDPTMLFAPHDRLRAAVRRLCEAAGDQGHVFNLGHGILPETDPRALEVVVEEVRRS